MKILKFLAIALIAMGSCVSTKAQVAPQITGSGAPSNPCYNGGQQYLDTTGHNLYNCPSSGSNWVNISLGNQTGSTGLAANSPGIPSANGNVFYLKNYGALFDVLNPTGCSGTSGQSSLTCTGANWIVTDQGKKVWESGTSNNTPDLHTTTITTVNSTTNVTVAGTFARNSSSGEAAYGHDDTSIINSTWTALKATGDCNASIHIPAGGTIISSAVMSTALPATCSFDQFPHLPDIGGEGFGASLFYPDPTNFSYFSTSLCGAASGAPYCFGPGRATFHDFGIYSGYGGGIVGANTYNGAWIGLLTPGFIKRVQIQEFTVPGNSAAVTISSGTASMDTVYIFGLGGNGSSAGCTLINNGASDIILSNIYLAGGCTEDGASLTSSGTNLNIYSVFGQSIVQNPLLFTGGSTTIYGDFGGFGRKATGAGTILNLVGAVNSQSAAALTNIITAASGAIVTVSGSVYKNTAAGTNHVFGIDATSKAVDGCGNTFSANTSTATVTAGGLFVPCPGTTYTGNLSLPTITGTGACATVSTQSGNMFSGQVTCTGTTGASTLIITPGITAANGWRCNADDVTTTTDLPHQTASSQSACTLSVTSVSANDVLTFMAQQF